MGDIFTDLPAVENGELRERLRYDCEPKYCQQVLTAAVLPACTAVCDQWPWALHAGCAEMAVLLPLLARCAPRSGGAGLTDDEVLSAHFSSLSEAPPLRCRCRPGSGGRPSPGRRRWRTGWPSGMRSWASRLEGSTGSWRRKKRAAGWWRWVPGALGRAGKGPLGAPF